MAQLSLAEIIQSMIDDDSVPLPVYPEVAAALLAGRPQPDEALLETVRRDPALVCTLLRSANSAFYKGLKKTVTVEEAITRLGRERAVLILEESCCRAGCFAADGLLARYLEPLWQHAIGCALGARWLARRCGYQAVADQAYLAGLMHDIGKLFLLAILDRIAGSGEYDMPISDQLAEEVIATMHGEQGARLVEEWNLPEIFGQVIAAHHDEDLDQQDTVVALVKLANQGCRKVGLGLKSDPGLVLPTTAEAQFLGISEVSTAEFEIMLEDHFRLVDPAALPA